MNLLLFVVVIFRPELRRLYESHKLYFSMDALMPLSFLALLKEDQFVYLLVNYDGDSIFLPILGVLGCAEYHMKNQRYPYSLVSPVQEKIYLHLIIPQTWC